MHVFSPASFLETAAPGIGFAAYRKFQHRERFVLEYLFRECRALKNMAKAVEVLACGSTLIHALQLERGTSTRWFSEKTASFEETLGAATKSTRQSEFRFKDLALSLDRLNLSRRFLTSVAETCRTLDQLGPLREQIRLRKVSAQETIVQFSVMVSAIISTFSQAAELSHHPEVARRIKEKAGQERATGAGQAKVEAWRILVRSAGAGGKVAGVQGDEWFVQATARIDALYSFEALLLQELRQKVLSAWSSRKAEFLSQGSSVKGARRWWIESVKRSLLRADRRAEDAKTAMRSLGDQSHPLWNEASNPSETRKQALEDSVLTFTDSVQSTLTRMNQALVNENFHRSGEIVVVTHQSAENIRRVTESVGDLSATLTEIRESADRCRLGAAQSLRVTESVRASVQELSSATVGIGEAVASIEAARAGSSGLGFAVVAREVKNLALKTRIAADRIVEALVQVREAVFLAEEKTNRIHGSMVTMHGAFEKTFVDLSKEDQTARDLVDHLHQLAAGSSQIEVAMGQLSGTAKETGQSAQRMDTSARDLGAEVETIHYLVDGFVAGVQNLR